MTRRSWAVADPQRRKEVQVHLLSQENALEMQEFAPLLVPSKCSIKSLKEAVLLLLCETLNIYLRLLSSISRSRRRKRFINWTSTTKVIDFRRF
ncbi:hypothetical protein GBA52_004308 [Prunus armeniaca]|nr:hypothetical protein GBA52_004308 [Prunus armeniaca]